MTQERRERVRREEREASVERVSCTAGGHWVDRTSRGSSECYFSTLGNEGSRSEGYLVLDSRGEVSQLVTRGEVP